jgi:tetratricopeptide (TPR) repeat protein
MRTLLLTPYSEPRQKVNSTGALMNPNSQLQTCLPLAEDYEGQIHNLRKKSDLAANMLFFAAILAQGDIPLSLLHKYSNEADMSDTLCLLKATSLVIHNDTEGRLTLSPVTRVAVRGYLQDHSLFSCYVTEAFGHINKCLPSKALRKDELVLCEQTLPHALAVWEEYHTLSCSQKIISTVPETFANNISFHLRSAGKYEQAHIYADKALSASIKVFGPSAKEILPYGRAVAICNNLLGRTNYAIETLDRMTRIHESITPRDVNSMLIHDETALTLQSQGRYDEAEEHHYMAINISIEEFGDEACETLELVHNLCWTLYYQQNYDQAYEWLQRITTTLNSRLGFEHAKTLAAFRTLGVVLQAQMHWDEAFDVHMRVLSGRHQLYGEQHLDTMATKLDLAAVYRAKEEYEAAESMTKDVVAFYKRALGDNHPSTLIALGDLGLHYRIVERYDEAARITEEVVHLRETRLGLDHPDTWMSMHDLAAIYHCQKRYSDALDMAQRTLDARRRCMHEEDPESLAIAAYVVELEENVRLHEAHLEWEDDTTLADTTSTKSGSDVSPERGV